MFRWLIEKLEQRLANRTAYQSCLQQAESPGLEFKVGDRVKHKNPRKVDDNGATGTIIATDVDNSYFPGYPMIRVRFDSGFDFNVFPSELVYQRD